MATRVLVTGGAGYLGAILVPRLLESGYEVCVLDSFLYGQASLLECCAHHGFNVIRGDARDEATLKAAMAGADYLIPLAAIVGAPACQMDATAARTVNHEAVRLLLSLRSRGQRVIYPTTNSGYGIGEKGKFCTEETPLRPISLYGRTKVDAEKAVLVFEGHAKRNYIHIRDVAAVFLHAMKNFETMGGRPYNVGLSDANLSKLELCAKIQKEVPKFVYIEAPVGEDPDKRDYIVSNERIERTGFKPVHSLEAGIRELIKGYAILRNARYSNV